MSLSETKESPSLSKGTNNNNIQNNEKNGRYAVFIENFKSGWYYFSQNKGAVAGLYFMIFICLVALFAGVLAPHGAAEQFSSSTLVPPAWVKGGSWKFILGTDSVGRDILSRIIYGARYSLVIGVIVILISFIFGSFLGLVSGFMGGIVDMLVTRIMDVVLAIPSLLLALVLVTILGPSLENAMISVAITYLPYFVRLTRASTLVEGSKDYVVASRLAGASKLRLMTAVILPNCLSPLIVQATMSFSNAILDAAALGFLGLGAQPPTPEWGTMLADAKNFILTSWWVATFPGLAILLTVLAVNLLGDGLRDALDPKMKR